MVGFDAGVDTLKVLDGESVANINPDLTTATDTTQAVPIPKNAGNAFIGVSMHGPFELDEEDGVRLLVTASGNVNGRPECERNLVGN